MVSPMPHSCTSRVTRGMTSVASSAKGWAFVGIMSKRLGGSLFSAANSPRSPPTSSPSTISEPAAGSSLSLPSWSMLISLPPSLSPGAASFSSRAAAVSSSGTCTSVLSASPTALACSTASLDISSSKEASSLTRCFSSSVNSSPLATLSPLSAISFPVAAKRASSPDSHHRGAEASRPCAPTNASPAASQTGPHPDSGVDEASSTGRAVSCGAPLDGESPTPGACNSVRNRATKPAARIAHKPAPLLNAPILYARMRSIGICSAATTHKIFTIVSMTLG
mmetsp:Transcript_8448/g.21921  ORF Transcript_8448/g.21921 Transcript_8448/m.21921 type:complete len:280 (+) Transcript_8448:2362-3201(+)